MNKLAVKIGVALLGLLISYFGVKKGRKLYKDFKKSGKTMDEIKQEVGDLTDQAQSELDKVNKDKADKVKECKLYSDSITNKEALDLADQMIADKLDKEGA
jgi:uncharacterized protein YoxC